ncbi:hypothetical protein QWZ06_10045 [Chryseobacterium tructae]|uniref:Lipoprotein n=1 Tax=Chryseobacterium tructae TaxID=1037380 RepID=A0ABV7XYV9_9FLAO|nr:hypothetical protein [Chryseobacterium tructae]MDN3692593.1 hypothetical protein [Chryseobacterium tructae]
MRVFLTLGSIILIISTICCANRNKNGSNEEKSTNATQQQKIEKIQLTERTRGINRNSIFTPTYKITVYNDDSTKYAMNPSEWEQIARQAGALDLSKISSYKAPTTGRYSDRALSATLIITSGGTAYTSAMFDAGYPPKELEGLYHTIQQPKGNKKENTKDH